MFQATHLIGFGARRRASAGVTTLIDRTSGSQIGDMTSNGGLAAAFDDTTSQGVAACARSAGGTPRGWIGKDWNGVGSGTKIITRFQVWGSSDFGFEAGSAAARIKLKGGSSVPTAFTSLAAGFNAGTELYTGDHSDTNGILIDISGGSINTTTAYRYHWVEILALTGSNEVYCAELRFWEDI